MRQRRRLPLLTALLALALAPAADASWFRAESIDGPGDIVALGGADVAQDGTGGLAYVKRAGGASDVFISRLIGGRWRAPARVGSSGAVTQAAIAAAEGKRLGIAWISGGQVFGAAVSGGAPSDPVQLSVGGGASALSIDMGVNGDAWAVWTEPGGGGSDVHAARLDDETWSPLPTPLDIDPAQPAGTGAGRARVAVSAEGDAVATWAEGHPDGRLHVYGRRLVQYRLSAVPQDLTLTSFDGRSGGSADAPDIDIEDDGSYAWIAFRQDIGGRSRTIARRLVGSLYERPEAIDGGRTSLQPRIAVSARGLGEAVAATAANGVVGAYLNQLDTFRIGKRIGGSGGAQSPSPVVSVSDRGDAAIAWRTGFTARASVKTSSRRSGRDVLVSRPSAGPVVADALSIASDRSGNSPLALLQGAAGARSVTAAVFDRPPGRPLPRSSSEHQRAGRPLLKWVAGQELWGRMRYSVYVDGRFVGSTRRTSLVGRRRYTQGLHRWYVVASDVRGQRTSSATRAFGVDR